MRKIKIHADLDLVKPGFGIPWLVRPLLEDNANPSGQENRADTAIRPVERILANYRNEASSIFELTPLEDCDFVVVPLHWHQVRGGYSWAAKPDREVIAAVQKSSEKARRLGKPVVIFFSESRSHEPVPVPGAIVFRNALYRSRRTALDQSMPVTIIADPQQEDYAAALNEKRAWEELPTVGFCGFSRPVRLAEKMSTALYKIYTLAKFGYPDVSQFKGLELRHAAIEILRQSSAVKTELIVRGESVFLTQDSSHSAKRAEYKEIFLRNITGSDYQLCMRGSANHSRRPWETFSCGRTPAFVDTDCVLPFDGIVDWSERMPIVDESDLSRLPEQIREFHARFATGGYAEFQDSQRRFWSEWLTPEGFAKQLARNYESLILAPLRADQASQG